MIISSFALGILIGSLAMLMFLYIVGAITSAAEKNKKPKSPINEDLVKELWHEYMKEMRDDGK